MHRARLPQIGKRRMVPTFLRAFTPCAIAVGAGLVVTWYMQWAMHGMRGVSHVHIAKRPWSTYRSMSMMASRTVPWISTNYSRAAATTARRQLSMKDS